MAKITKISMNLSEKSIQNIDEITNLTHVSNKTTAVATALSLARTILEQIEDGKKVVIKNADNSEEQELKFLY
jgi:hypothetical protein